MLFLPALLIGCFGAEQFDGTWLFSFDAQADYGGDCAPDPEDAVYTYTGTNNSWVDIYTTGGGGLVVLIDQALTGEAEGSTFSASWSQDYEEGDYSSHDEIGIEAELAAGELTGEVKWLEATASGEDLYSCETTGSFTAWKSTTGPDEIAGN